MTRGDKQKFAAFDIDGTLIRWQLYHAIVDELGRRNHIPPELHQKIIEARKTWQSRQHVTSFKDYEETLVDVYHQALTGLSSRMYQNAVDTVFATYKDQVYTYTRDLVKSLKADGYLLFAISGSQQEVVQKLGDYYGFDEVIGTTYEQADGYLTGKWKSVYGHKKEILTELMRKYDLSKKGSVAIGDSPSDIPMLELVERPIAFNPDKALFEYAKEQGWEVILERKNMVYELESRDGQYVLAKTRR
jgi:HAD superfamily hydrolase (TIGR01490 family)